MAFFCPKCSFPFTLEEASEGKCPECDRGWVARVKLFFKPFVHRIERPIVATLRRAPLVPHIMVTIGWLLFFCGILATIVASAAYIAEISVIFSLGANRGSDSWWIMPVWFAGSVGVSTGVWCRRIGRRILAVQAFDVRRNDSRPPILYLRSFQFDQSLLPVETLIPMTYEERLARRLNKVGPFVAIGRPGELLPELGAQRVYVGHDSWQQQVTDLMQCAGAVLVAAGGRSEGLRWEVDQATFVVEPERLLIFVPFGSSPKPSIQSCSRQAIYDKFRRWAQQVFPKGLPAEIGDSCFIYFTSDWTPCLLPRPRIPFLLGITRLRLKFTNKVIQPFLEIIHQDGFFLRQPSLGFRIVSASVLILLFVSLVVFLIGGEAIVALLCFGILLGLPFAQRKLWEWFDSRFSGGPGVGSG